MVLGDGVLAELPGLIESHAPANRYAIVTDSNVGELYGERLARQLGGENHCRLFSFGAGEQSKTRTTWIELTDELLSAGFGRDSLVVALGGGVVGDVAGFLAATYLRGVPHVQIPTSLLAMIDSSVGGKTGVDTPHGKNLVGAFHQPSLVVTDVATLKTLPRREFTAGIAEAIKHGAIADVAYFERLTDLQESIFSQEPEALIEMVGRSISIKAEVVADYEREHGRRAMLNFGHTIAHALEVATDYDLLHGEAVAIGMLAEAKLGTHLGITEPDVADRLRAAIEAFDLPVEPCRALAQDRLLGALAQDKKSRDGTVRFTLLERLGKVASDPVNGWTHSVPETAIEQIMRSLH